MKTRKKICFVHLPKCGGTSTRAALRKGRGWWDKGYVSLHSAASSQAAELQQVDALTYRESLLTYFLSHKKYDFVSGHFGCSLQTLDRFSPEWTFITLLRDPVDRWFSHYFFDRYKQGTHKKTELSIGDYMASQEGKLQGTIYLRHFNACRKEADIRSDAARKEALEALAKIQVVGFLDEQHQFFNDLQQALGLRIRLKNKNRNPANEEKKKLMQDPEIRKKVIDLCEPDIALYESLRAKKP